MYSIHDSWRMHGTTGESGLDGGRGEMGHFAVESQQNVQLVKEQITDSLMHAPPFTCQVENHSLDLLLPVYRGTNNYFRCTKGKLTALDKEASRVECL